MESTNPDFSGTDNRIDFGRSTRSYFVAVEGIRLRWIRTPHNLVESTDQYSGATNTVERSSRAAPPEENRESLRRSTRDMHME